MAGDRELEHEQDDPEPDQQQPGDVEGQAAEADEREDDREGAQDAGHEVGRLELEQEAVEPEREQDERDVRVGQQVQERLERVHRQLRGGGPGRRDHDRLAADLDGPPVARTPARPRACRRCRRPPRPTTASDAGDERRFGDRLTRPTRRCGRAPRRSIGCGDRIVRTLSPSVPGMSSPWPPTGDAAPMFVPGAMSAT